MPIETRSNSALFRRAEQLKRWEDSETNNVSSTIPFDKNFKIKFSDSCVFLAACTAGDTEEVERLLNLGADINTANVDGLTALHQACIDNNFEMVQFLVEHGCDVNRGDNEGWTPLHATASCGFLSIAKYLIEHGANVAAVNNDGDLPIDIAELTDMEDYLSDVLDAEAIDCEEARAEEERIMLEDAKLMASSSLDPNEKIHIRTGATPLHVAAAKGYIEVIKTLIQAGVDLNAQDNDGWTPLHAAAHWCQKEACAILADSLANMDIQNFAGQTCFDVADPDLVALLEELKKKQASMQKDRPEIQAILQRTSSRPPLKRRTSVTRMSGQEKSKSVMKDTKSERAQIENLTLPEEENDEDKEKKSSDAGEITKVEDAAISVTKKPSTEPQPQEVRMKDTEEENIPSWKKVLRRATDESNATTTVPEVVLKRPKKLTEESKDESVNRESRPTIPPVRDEESELQRKAHAKRVRETRRSTQGVLLEDIKSAELQYLISTQQEAAKRQVDESVPETGSKDKLAESQSISTVRSEQSKGANDTPVKIEKPVLDLLTKTSSDLPTKTSSDLPTKTSSDLSTKIGSDLSTKTSSDLPTKTGSDALSSPNTNEPAPSVTLVLRSKSASSPEDTSPSESRSSLGTQAAIQRRRRPKRRSTGVVYLDSDEAPEEKESPDDKDSSSPAEHGQTERHRQRYGSSTSIPDTASEVSFKSDASSRYSSKASLGDDDNVDYKKLYEDAKKENDRLKESLRKTEEELEKTKKQLQKLTQTTVIKNSASDSERKERRTLERKLSELEEEVKQIDKLRTDNERLKDENAALIRVISKISQ